MKDQKQEALTHFEGLASSGRWESLYTKNSYNFVTRRQEVIKMLSGLEYDSVVDLGSGTGDYADYFYKNGKQYLGVDNSGEMVLNARKRFPGSSFQVDDVENLSLAPERFDLALAIGLVEYFARPGKVIQNVHKVVKKGGYFIAQAPHRSLVWKIDRITFGILHPLILLRSYLRKRPIIYHAFHTESTLRALIEPAGFEYCMTSYCNYRLVPWPFSYGSYWLERRVSENITEARNKSKFAFLAVNIIVLFRKK